MRFLRSAYFLPVLVLLLSSCTVNYIKQEELRTLDEEYKGTYVILKNISTGKNDVIQKGTQVRLYFQSGPTSVKVYAYEPDQSREGAIGKLILYMFDTDFPDKLFLKELLAKKLSELVKRVGE